MSGSTKDNEIYLLYTKKDIAEKLDVSEQTVYNCFNELEDASLIKQERQGLNKPNKLFIAKTKANKAGKAPSETDLKKSLGQDIKKSLGQDINNMEPSETKCIETDRNDTEKETQYIDPHQQASQRGSMQCLSSYDF